MSPSPATCPACNRPLPPHDATCVYCGEGLPRTAAQRLPRIVVATIALAGPAALAVVHPPAWPPNPATGEEFLLLALGLGLAILPPRMPGVPAANAGERLRQAAARASSGLLLTLLSAAALLSTGAPQPWTPAAAALAAVTGLALVASVLLIGLSWLSLAAGLLLGAGLAGIAK